MLDTFHTDIELYQQEETGLDLDTGQQSMDREVSIIKGIIIQEDTFNKDRYQRDALLITYDTFVYDQLTYIVQEGVKYNIKAIRTYFGKHEVELITAQNEKPLRIITHKPVDALVIKDFFTMGINSD